MVRTSFRMLVHCTEFSWCKYGISSAINGSLCNCRIWSSRAGSPFRSRSQTVTFSASSLIMVAILQTIIQGFVFAFVTLYKVEFYLTVRERRKITDFDYTFDEKKP